MSGIMDLLKQQLNGSVMSQISRHLGTDVNKVQAAIGTALPALLGALARNAQKPEGANAVADAVARDHDGSIFDNLSGFLGNAQDGPGSAILGHVFGGQKQNVEQQVSKSTGLDRGTTGHLMEMLAPMVMGALGKKTQDTSGAVDMASMLNNERQSIESRPEAKGLKSLLDRDGDGDVDLGDLTAGLGKFFG